MEMYMSRFEEASCKVLGVILFLILCILTFQLMGCMCPIPEAPIELEYIDEVKMENYAYIKYIPDWYVVPDKLEDRLILPIYFIDEVDMSNYA